jgi:hypothetical protein
MKTFFFFMFITISFLSNGQNRSALELARENTNNYLGAGVFKGQTYKQTSIGELKPFDIKSSTIEWMMDQKVEAIQTRKVSDSTSKMLKQEYRFRFYLDHKMEVIRSECYFTVNKD